MNNDSNSDNDMGRRHQGQRGVEVELEAIREEKRAKKARKRALYRGLDEEARRAIKDFTNPAHPDSYKLALVFKGQLMVQKQMLELMDALNIVDVKLEVAEWAKLHGFQLFSKYGDEPLADVLPEEMKEGWSPRKLAAVTMNQIESFLTVYICRLCPSSSVLRTLNGASYGRSCTASAGVTLVSYPLGLRMSVPYCGDELTKSICSRTIS